MPRATPIARPAPVVRRGISLSGWLVMLVAASVLPLLGF